MNRRQEIESIIIGTILNSFNGDDYLINCKSCITADMFSDERNKVIYSKAIEMSKSGLKEITPQTMLQYDSDMTSLLPYILDLATDWNFVVKKAEYNSNVYYTDHSKTPRYTMVKFDDYITRFIKLVFANG